MIHTDFTKDAYPVCLTSTVDTWIHNAHSLDMLMEYIKKKHGTVIS